MKASRAPGPVQSYALLHNKKQNLPVNNKATNSSNTSSSSKKAPPVKSDGILKKFIDLDDIPDFPADEREIVITSARSKCSEQNYDNNSYGHGVQHRGNDKNWSYEHRNHNSNNHHNSRDQCDDNFDEDEFQNDEDYDTKNNFKDIEQYNQYDNYHSPRANANNYDSDGDEDEDNNDFEEFKKLPPSPSKKYEKGNGKPTKSIITKKEVQDKLYQSKMHVANAHVNQGIPQHNPPPLPYEQQEHTSKKELEGKDKLYFSKEPRPVEFKPYTLKQYSLVKPKEYVEIPKLQPDLNSEDLVEKRKKLEKIKQFSQQLRQVNQEQLSQQRKLPPTSEQQSIMLTKNKLSSKRQRAMDFARHIPRPMQDKQNLLTGTAHGNNADYEDFYNSSEYQQQRRGEERDDEFDDAYNNMTKHLSTGKHVQGVQGQQARKNNSSATEDTKEALRLQELEAKHQQKRQQIEAIKKSLGRVA